MTDDRPGNKLVAALACWVLTLVGTAFVYLVTRKTAAEASVDAQCSGWGFGCELAPSNQAALSAAGYLAGALVLGLVTAGLAQVSRLRPVPVYGVIAVAWALVCLTWAS